MEIKQLQYFLEVAQSGNMTKSAQKLYVSQQALSKAIRTLEKELGVQLFQRSVNGMKLTEYGKCLKPYASRVLLDAEAGAAAVQQLQAANQYPIHFGVVVGCLHPFSAVQLPRLSEWERQNPHTSLFVQEDEPQALLQGLLSEELDLACFLSLDRQPPPGCCARVLLEEPIGILTAEELPAEPNFERLREMPILMGRVGESPVGDMYRLYEKAGYVPHLAYYNGPFDQCAERARNREGIVLAGESYGRAACGNGLRVYPFPDREKRMYNLLLWKKGRDHPAAVRRLISWLT